MRLFLDENLSPALADALCAAGYDATSAYAQKLSSASDHDIRAYCIRHNYTLVTLDADFGNVLRFSPSGTPGVIWLRPSSFSNAFIASLLDSALLRLKDKDIKDMLAVVDETTIRIRPGVLSS